MPAAPSRDRTSSSPIAESRLRGAPRDPPDAPPARAARPAAPPAGVLAGAPGAGVATKRSSQCTTDHSRLRSRETSELASRSVLIESTSAARGLGRVWLSVPSGAPSLIAWPGAYAWCASPTAMMAFLNRMGPMSCTDERDGQRERNDQCGAQHATGEVRCKRGGGLERGGCWWWEARCAREVRWLVGGEGLHTWLRTTSAVKHSASTPPKESSNWTPICWARPRVTPACVTKTIQ